MYGQFQFGSLSTVKYIVNASELFSEIIVGG